MKKLFKISYRTNTSCNSISPQKASITDTNDWEAHPQHNTHSNIERRRYAFFHIYVIRLHTEAFPAVPFRWRDVNIRPFPKIISAAFITRPMCSFSPAGFFLTFFLSFYYLLYCVCVRDVFRVFPGRIDRRVQPVSRGHNSGCRSGANYRASDDGDLSKCGYYGFPRVRFFQGM